MQLPVIFYAGLFKNTSTLRKGLRALSTIDLTLSRKNLEVYEKVPEDPERLASKVLECGYL